MSIEPRFEVGVDYDGVSPRHHQLNEVRTFSNDKTDRIFFPECGAFYTEKLFIKDINTGRELIRGTDYDCMIIDSKATNNSGMEVCGVINVTNPEISGVALDYQFVGGLHMTGYYLLEQLMKMYPNGASAIVSYDDLINVPDEFDPAYHTQHVHEFFGTESLLVWIERIRQGIIQHQESNLNSLYDNAQSAIDDLYATLQENVDRLKQEIQDTLDKLKIQTDEYIITDSSANPATTRGYGVWQLITDSVLYGVTGTTFLVGSGGSIAIGGEQIIRNCYIWKNIEGTTLTETNIVVTSDKDAVNEGEPITFTIAAANVPNGTRYTWAISDAEAKDFTSALTGVVTINNGTATITVTTKKDYITDGDKNHVFYIVEYARARKPFVVLDTSLTSKINQVVFMDNGNTSVLSAVSEDQTFKLAISTTGMQGSTVYLKWTLSTGLTAADFSTTLPTSVVITGNTTYVSITTVGNLKEDVDRYLKVLATEVQNEAERSMSKTATIAIIDTSKSFEGALSFLDARNLAISSLDEDKEFKIRLKTNGGVGRTVNFTYQTNKEMYEFSGLVNSAVIAAGNIITINARHLADYVTRVEPEFLVVKAFDGTRQIAEGTLMFNDTSKTLNFQVLFSKTNDGSEPITTVNEGEDFYIIFQVPGWVGASTAPVLDIQYTLLGSPNLVSRVASPSKTTGLSFDGNNNTMGVQWVNYNTLAIKNTAVADKAIYGDAIYSFKWKASHSSRYSDPVELTILDTSKPRLTTTWSSSNTTLTPVTTVDEMTTLGVRKVVYLWIEVDGNATTYRNLKLAIGGGSTANQADLITVFPNNLTINAGANKHIVTVEINNDFLTEGNEKIQLVATADNVDGNIFVSEITIVDNSVQTTLSLTTSTSASNVVPPTNNLFSEWAPAYVIVTHESFAFNSVLTLSITNSDKLESLPVSVTALANTTKTVVTINPASGRNSWGNHNHVLTVRRTFDGKNLTATATINVNFTNDKVNPSLTNVRITSDATGNTSVTELSEGVTYYVHATINKPTVGLVGVIGIIDNTDSGSYGGLQRLSFANNKKVLVRSTTDSNTTINMSVAFSIPFDRKTNSPVTKLRFAAKIDWSSSKTVNQVYDEDITVTDSTSQSTTIERTLVDTSKTLLLSNIRFVDSDDVVRNRFNEGEDFYIEATVSQGTIGDVYNIVHDVDLSTVTLSRFSYHEFSSKDITITTKDSQKLRWKASILANMFTDGEATGYVKLYNKTSGEYITYNISYTIADSSRTPEHAAVWLPESDTTVISSVNEGATFRLQIRTMNLPADSQVRITRVSGRPLTDFSSHEIGTTKTLTTSGSNADAFFTFTLNNNAKTDTVNNLVVKYEIIQYPNINGNATINIVDTSQTRSFGTVEWRANNANGAIITSVSEGSTVALVVKAAGGTQSLAIKVDNDGGRAVSLMDSHEYGVSKTRTSDTETLTWTFTPKADSTTNTGADLNLKVKLYYVDDPTISRTLTLPINDTSKSVGYSAKITSDSAGNNIITSANEGSLVYLALTTTGVESGQQYTWEITGTTTFNGIQGYTPLSGSLTTNANGKVTTAITINRDELTQSNKRLNISIKSGSTVVANIVDFPINDVSKTPTIDNVYWSTRQDGSDSITSVTNGQVFYLIVKSSNIEQTSAKEFSLTFGGTAASTDFTTDVISGTRTIDIGTYTSTTGAGHTWYMLQVVAAPEPPPVVLTNGDVTYSTGYITGKVSAGWIGGGSGGGGFRVLEYNPTMTGTYPSEIHFYWSPVNGTRHSTHTGPDRSNYAISLYPTGSYYHNTTFPYGRVNAEQCPLTDAISGGYANRRGGLEALKYGTIEYKDSNYSGGVKITPGGFYYDLMTNGFQVTPADGIGSPEIKIVYVWPNGVEKAITFTASGLYDETA